MQPTPFTRSVLARINADARNGIPAAIIAHSLAWQLDRLQRVARAHGIELDLRQIPDLPPLPTPPMRSLDALALTLPQGQADVFYVLRRAKGDWLAASLIAQRTGIVRGSVITAIHYLRRKLVGTGFVIEAKTGAGAGYRLRRENENVVGPEL